MRNKLSYALSGDETLPDGWEWSTVGKVADVTAGNPAPQGAEFFQGGTKPFVRVQDMGRLGPLAKLHETHDYINDKAANKLRLFPQGTVLFTKSGASTLLNQRAILARDMYVVSHIGTAIPKAGITSEWLYYWMRTVDFAYLAHATTLPSLPLPKAKAIPIPVPPPQQQKLIVAEIEKQFSRLDEAVANLKRIKANLKRYKAAVLKAAVEGKLTEAWRKAHPDVEPASKLLDRILINRRDKWTGRGKYPESTQPDNSKLPSLPKGWIWATADQFCDFITKGTTPAAQKLRETTGDIPFIKVYNLTFSGRLDLSIKPAFVDRAVHEGELGRSKTKKGDVLINIVGPPLGQVAIVPDSLAEANINQAIARLRVLVPMSNRYVAVALMSESIMGWAIKRAKTTAGQANLTLELCRALPFPLPPTEEQGLIVSEVERRLSIIDELEDTIEANLTRADRLRQSILHQAFSGELACFQQPMCPASSETSLGIKLMV